MAHRENDFYQRLGASIRRSREEADLTQTELAAMVGVSRTSLTNMELGRQRILVDQLASVAMALNTSVGDLMSNIELEDKALASKQKLPRTVSQFLNKFNSVEEVA